MSRAGRPIPPWGRGARQEPRERPIPKASGWASRRIPAKPSDAIRPAIRMGGRPFRVLGQKRGGCRLEGAGYLPCSPAVSRPCHAFRAKPVPQYQGRARAARSGPSPASPYELRPLPYCGNWRTMLNRSSNIEGHEKSILPFYF